MTTLAECSVKAAYWLAAESSTFPAYRINGCLFDHLFCGFAAVSCTTYEVELPSPTDPFKTFSQIVKVCSNVKTILSIGGKTFQLETFASMASRKEYRRKFIDSSIKLARQYGFDGLDLSWIYPRNQTEMKNLGALLVEWRDAIGKDGQSIRRPPLLLTAAVYFSPVIAFSSSTYPTDEMTKNLDWVNVIAYDLTDPSQSPKATAAPAPLFNPGGGPCVDGGIEEWLKRLPACKVVLGLPFYGYAWILADPNQNGVGAPADGPYGKCNGFMTYREIKNLLGQGFNPGYDRVYVTNYCYQGITWVAYDGPENIKKTASSIKEKVSYAKDKDLLGYFGFTVGWDSDDAELARAAFKAWG